MEILRLEVFFDEDYQIEKKGNTVHVKCMNDGSEYWKTYDKNGNEIYFKDSTGYECWNEYDERGKMVHQKDSDGFECWSGIDKSTGLEWYVDNTGFGVGTWSVWEP